MSTIPPGVLEGAILAPRMTEEQRAAKVAAINPARAAGYWNAPDPSVMAHQARKQPTTPEQHRPTEGA